MGDLTSTCYGPHDMADRAKAEQVDGQFFGNPVPQAMNHVNH